MSDPRTDAAQAWRWAWAFTDCPCGGTGRIVMAVDAPAEGAEPDMAVDTMLCGDHPALAVVDDNKPPWSKLAETPACSELHLSWSHGGRLICDRPAGHDDNHTQHTGQRGEHATIWSDPSCWPPR